MRVYIYIYYGINYNPFWLKTKQKVTKENILNQTNTY